MGKSYQQQYADILKRLIHKPDKQTPSRVGDVRSRFVETIRVDLEKEFPLMEIKDVSFKNILVELLWFINGETNIKYLVDNGCNIWNDDAYRYYKEKYSPYRFSKSNGQLSLDIDDEITKEEFIKRVKNGEKLLDRFRDSNGLLSDNLAWIDTKYSYGDLDRVYGYQWRNFNGSSDQLLNCIQTLKTNPDDRRMIVSAHNPTDLETGNVGLPSCHNYFQFYTKPMSADERAKLLGEQYYSEMTFETDADIHKYADEKGLPSRKLSLYYNIRSNDFFLGQPYNTPSYAILLMIVAKVVNMTPSEVVCNAVDCHLYEKHLGAAEEWLRRYDERFYSDSGSNNERQALFTYCHSSVKIKRNVDSIDGFNISDFELKNYNSDGRIKAELLT